MKSVQDEIVVKHCLFPRPYLASQAHANLNNLSFKGRNLLLCLTRDYRKTETLTFALESCFKLFFSSLYTGLVLGQNFSCLSALTFCFTSF